MIELHEEDVQEVNADEHINSILVDSVALHEVTHQPHVEQKEDGITG